MKRLLILSAAVLSFQALSGEVIDRKNGDRILVQCIERSEDACNLYDVHVESNIYGGEAQTKKLEEHLGWDTEFYRFSEYSARGVLRDIVRSPMVLHNKIKTNRVNNILEKLFDLNESQTIKVRHGLYNRVANALLYEIDKQNKQ